MLFGFMLSLLTFFALVLFPGYVLFRTVGVGRLVSFACAPTPVILLLVILGAGYSSLGIAASPTLMFAPVFAICLLPGIIRSLRRRILSFTYSGTELASPLRSPVALHLALCLFVSLGVVCYFMLYRGIQNPDDFIQIYDNTFHLSVTRSMADAGDFSIFSVGAYQGAASSIDPTPADGFYPAAWHVLAALLSQVLSFPVTSAVNFINALFMGVVFPTGVFALIAETSERDLKAMLAGAFVPMLFVAFPWVFLYWGPLYSNLAAFCLVPGVMALFVSQTQASAGGLRGRLPRLAFFGLAMLALVFVQPNAVFTLGVWAAPYCVYRLATTRFLLLESRVRLRGTKLNALLVAGFICFVVLTWAFFYNSSFMSGVVGYSDWAASGGVTDAIWRIASFSLASSLPQYGLSILVCLGVVYTLLRPKYLWLTCSALIAAAFFAVDIVSNGVLRHVLTGFWYTDTYRTAAMVAMFCMPLAAFGLASLFQAALMICGGTSGVHGTAKAAAVSLFVAATVCGCVLWPYKDGSEIDTSHAFGKALSAIRWMYSLDDANNNLTREEAEFVQEALELVPDDAVVLNQPYDGSVFAYAAYDLNLYYRKFNEGGAEGETPESRLLHSEVNECASNEEVRTALERTGVEYLLILDLGEKSGEGRSMPGYNEGDWAGIDAVRDDTPGFEIVLAEDDMRLYRIVV